EITVKDIVTEIEEETVSLKTKGTDKTYTLHYNVIGRSSSIRWTTSDNKVATVSKGKITAKKAGTTTITATANGISDTVEVTVSVYDPTISLSQPEYTLYTKKGNTYTLKAAIDGPVKKAVWESSNPEVATVVNGKVTAVGEGQTVITASANGVTAECLITVKESKVILGTENITLDKGETAQLPADVVGYSQTLAYTTTNSKVATVKNGIITAKSYGEADIKVTANGVSAVCHVKVGVCEHIYNEGVVTKEATCTEPGVKTFTCTLCGDAYTEDIPLKDHEYANTSVTAPTCTEKGYTTHTCTCGDSYVDTYVDALGHAWGEWITTKEPTETETGEKKHICSRCKAEETESIPVKEHEHIYTETVTAPTCTEKGYTTHTCTCGDSYVDTYTDATGHDAGEWVTTKEPDVGVTGQKELQCTKCGYVLDTEEIEMLTTDGTDSVYYFKNADGSQEMVVGHYNEDEVQEMLNLVNNYREENGLDTFTMPTTYMSSYTDLRAVETSYLWDHARPSGAGCEYAENIAMGPPDGRGNTPSVQAIFDAWVGSPGHKENLDAVRIKNWTCISVFYKKCPVYNSAGEVSRYVYTAYWVETFK
ncbi:MAG: Ig-like domain-containing protein, partial [Phocaeicola sp.]